MKILIVEDDEALRSLLVKELEERGYDTRQSFRGDEAFYIWQHEGPWKLVLSDYRFIPGTKIKDGVQLVTAIHEMNPSQKMAIMTAEPEEARENCRTLCGCCQCCGSLSKSTNCCEYCGSPCCRFKNNRSRRG